MNLKTKSYLEVHIAVLLFGMTGLFGKLLTLNPMIIVLGRVFFSSIFIAVWMLIRKEGFGLHHGRDYRRLVGMGILLAVHWTSFFGSIQLSNVAIGLLTFSTFPVFVSIFKPVLLDSRIRFKEIIFGIITLVGILFIVPLNDIYSSTMTGGIVGVFSGGVYAVFTIYNERLVSRYSGRKVAFYEQVVATVFLLPSLWLVRPVVTLWDIGLLILLGTVFTGIGHTMFINGLKNVTAYMASIITMLEPLYAIVLAYFLLGETVSWQVLVGGSIILGTVVFISMDARNA